MAQIGSWAAWKNKSHPTLKSPQISELDTAICAQIHILQLHQQPTEQLIRENLICALSASFRKGEVEETDESLQLDNTATMHNAGWEMDFVLDTNLISDRSLGWFARTRKLIV